MPAVTVNHYNSHTPVGGDTIPLAATVDPNKCILFCDSNRYGTAGRSSDETTARDPADLSVIGQINAGGTAIDVTRVAGSDNATYESRWTVVEYTGPSNGVNEFRKVTSRTSTLNGATTNDFFDINGLGVLNASKLVPVITGIHNESTSGEADSGTAAIYFSTSGSDIFVNVDKGTTSNNVTIQFDIIEFTGINWKVHWAATQFSGTTNPIVGNIVQGVSGDFEASAVTGWANAFIINTYRASKGIAAGTYDAVCDNYPVVTPNFPSLAQVTYTFNNNYNNDDSESISYVIENEELTVNRMLGTSTSSEASFDLSGTVNTSSDDYFAICFSTCSRDDAWYPMGSRVIRSHYPTLVLAAARSHTPDSDQRIQVVNITSLSEDVTPMPSSLVGTSIIPGITVNDLGYHQVTVGSSLIGAPGIGSISNLGKTVRPSSFPANSVIGGTNFISPRKYLRPTSLRSVRIFGDFKMFLISSSRWRRQIPERDPWTIDSEYKQ